MTLFFKCKYFNDNLNIPRLESKINCIKNKFNFHENVYVEELSKKDLEELLQEEIPQWVVATNIRNNIILIDKIKNNTEEYIEEVIVHEYIHIILNRLTNFKCPLYLSDGLAMYYADQKVENVKLDHLKNINLNTLNYSRTDFYILSKNIVDRIIKKYSEEFLINKIKSRNYTEIEQIIYGLM